MLKNNKKKEPVLKLSKIIHLLGEILGFVVKEQEGVTFFNKVANSFVILIISLFFWKCSLIP